MGEVIADNSTAKMMAEYNASSSNLFATPKEAMIYENSPLVTRRAFVGIGIRHKWSEKRSQIICERYKLRDARYTHRHVIATLVIKMSRAYRLNG